MLVTIKERNELMELINDMLDDADNALYRKALDNAWIELQCHSFHDRPLIIYAFSGELQEFIREVRTNEAN